jgi:hypothetical protein
MRFLASDDLAPGEVLGPLLDAFEYDGLEEGLNAMDNDLRRQIREFLEQYHPVEVPFAVFGPGSAEEDARWKAARKEKYELLLRLLGVETG